MFCIQISVSDLFSTSYCLKQLEILIIILITNLMSSRWIHTCDWCSLFDWAFVYIWHQIINPMSRVCLINGPYLFAFVGMVAFPAVVCPTDNDKYRLYRFKWIKKDFLWADELQLGSSVPPSSERLLLPDVAVMNQLWLISPLWGLERAAVAVLQCCCAAAQGGNSTTTLTGCYSSQQRRQRDRQT